MPKGKPIREEDKQALIDLVREEIEAYRCGRLERFSTNLELAEVMGVSVNSIGRYLDALSIQDRKSRTDALRGIPREEDIQTLIELVKQEIEAYRDGRIDKMSSLSDITPMRILILVKFI